MKYNFLSIFGGIFTKIVQLFFIRKVHRLSVMSSMQFTIVERTNFSIYRNFIFAAREGPFTYYVRVYGGPTVTLTEFKVKNILYLKLPFFLKYLQSFNLLLCKFVTT